MNMKWIYGLFIMLLFACDDKEIGYLDISRAEYSPNEMEIPKYEDLDAIEQWQRLELGTPWVTLRMQGVLGTEPIIYSIESVKASDGGNADLFKGELEIIGGGTMYYPIQPKAPAGTYVVSIRLTNEGYSKVLENAYTFIVK